MTPVPQSKQCLDPRSTHASSQDALLSGVAEAAKRLLAIADFDAAVNGALEAIALAAGIDRIFIYENRFEQALQEDVADCLYEWISPELLSRWEDCDRFSLIYSQIEGFPDWLNALKAGNPVQVLAKDLATIGQTIQRPVPALSALTVPIFLGEDYWGNLGFEDCAAERIWNTAEIAVLETAAACIGSAIERFRTQKARQLAEQTVLLEREAAAQIRAQELEAYNQQLRDRDSLLKCVNAAAQCLVANDDLTVALQAMLKILGEGTQQCRAYILRNSQDQQTGELIFNLELEWDAPDIPTKLESGARFPVPVSHFPAHLSAPLKAGKATQFFARELDGIRPEDRPPGHARSLIGVPITMDGQWWGLLGLDDCLNERLWSEAEIAVLETAATAVGSALERDQARQVREAAEREILIGRERATRAAELEAANAVLTRRDRWLETTAAAANELLSTTDIDASVAAALQTIGENLDCDRVEVIKRMTVANDSSGDLGFARNIYEWCAPGIDSHINDPALRDMQRENIADAVLQQLLSGQWVGGIADELGEPIRSQQRALGQKAFYVMPVLKDGELWGVVCIVYCRQAKRLSSAEIAAFKTTATCVGSAIYQADVRRDQAAQERAKLLGSVAKAANLLLRSADYTTVLSDVVQLLGEAVGSARCSITQDVKHPRSGKLAVKLLKEWRINPSVSPAHSTHVFFDEDDCLTLDGDFLGFHQALCRGDVVNFLVADLTPKERDLMEAQGNTSMLIVPIMVQGQCWGEIGFDNCGEPRLYDEAEISILRVAAESIASAIARQAQDEALRNVEKAVLEEREKAAQQRASELARINESISKTLTALAASPELDQFLGSTLAEVAQQVGAYSVHMFLFDPIANTLTLSLVVEDGEIYIGPGPNDPDFFRRPVPADHTPAWASAVRSGKPLNYDENTPHDAKIWWPEAIVWHQAQGHKAATCIPMIAGTQPIGFLGIAFRDRTILSPAQVEFMQALVNQAIIAIQLTRLAEQNQAAALCAALSNERTRLAREIHDTLAQSFTGVSLQLEAVRGLTRKLTEASSQASSVPVSSLEDAQTYIRRARDLARKGLSEARRSVQALRSEALETDNLTDALRKMLDQPTRDTGLKTQFHLSGEAHLLPDDLQLNLLRIAQETVTNVLRHAQATQLTLMLSFSPHQICLQAIDDGVGFEVRSLEDIGGFGLIGIRERSTRFGGQVNIFSQPAQGTRIEVVMPLSDRLNP